MLAVKVLQEQGIEVVPINFKSYFFGPDAQAAESAKELGVELRVKDFSKEHLKMVKEPPHGYGKAANPCIDCHAMMMARAKEIMEREDFAFIASGEVLGERPMSQNKGSLNLVEKMSGLKGLLLRPLSAKLLPPTVAEEKGLVDREKLLDISGRGRKPQMELAKKYGIRKYPTPAGGCLLTDPGYGTRLLELLAKNPEANGNDMELLKVGRHFWEGGCKIVIGRDQEDNKRLEKISRPEDVVLRLKDFAGPLVLVRGKDILQETIEEAASYTAYYSTKARTAKEVSVEYRRGNEKKEISAEPKQPRK